MRRVHRMIAVLVALAMMLALMPGVAGAQEPGVWYVDASVAESGTGGSLAEAFGTIGKAIAVASSGDTVLVAPGVYDESITINRQLTVESIAGPDDTVIDRGNVNTTLVNITADCVTFSGFTVQNAKFGIKIGSNENVVENNIIADISKWSIELNGIDNYLEGNVVRDQGSWGEERQPRGIFLYNAEEATLRNNSLINAGFSSGSNLETHDIDSSNTVNGKPVYYWIGHEGETVPTDAGMVWLINCSKMTVQNLNIDSTERAIFISGGSGHLVTNNTIGADEPTFPGQRNVTHRAIWVQSCEDAIISNNIIYNAKCGIEVQHGQGNIVEGNSITDTKQAIVFQGGTDNSAVDNTLVNPVPGEYVPAKWTAGFTLWNDAQDTLLDGNEVVNFEWGINQDFDPRSGGQLKAYGTVARDNWISGSAIWGAATGADSGRSLDVRANWWGGPSGPAHIGDNVVFEPWFADEDLTQLSSTKPVINATKLTTHDTTQAAIDAAESGDTIVVAPGTYTGNLVVGIDELTLRSAVLHGAEVQGTVVVQSDDVVIDGFKITNFNQIPAPDWSAVYIPSGTNVQVLNSLIDGAAIDPVDNLTVGVHTLYGGTADVRVEGNTISNVRMGVYNQGATMNIQGNTIANTAHCAIGVDTALGTTISHNQITDCSLGVEVFAKNVTLARNRIMGNAVGVENHAEDELNATVNYWGQKSGPASGDVAGDVLTNPWCLDEACDIDSDKLTLDVTVSGNGTWSRDLDPDDEGYYKYGDVVTLSAAPAAGYEFSSWSGDVDAKTSSATTVLMDWHKSARAVFVKRGAPPVVPPPEEPEVIGSAAAEIDPEVGGDLVLPDDSVSLNVPAGATTTTTSFDVIELDEAPEVPGTFTVAGKAVQITATDEDGNPVREFGAPLTITFQLTEEDVDGDWEDLVVMFYDEELGWVALETVVDPETGTVTATFDHLTVFAVIRVTPPEIYGAQEVVMQIGETEYTADGEEGEMDLAPFIEDDRTFVPVRFLAEAFGAEADWEPKDGPVETVTLTRADITITIEIGSKQIKVDCDGELTSVESDVAAFIRDGRTVLPFRVIAEAFGATVDYGPLDGPVEWVSFEQ